MVARVPLFAHLTAGDIAHIAQLLRARRVDRNEIIVRRGEPAHSMYFVTEGEVEIEPGLDQSKRGVRLGAGHFFGERAILKETTRSSTVRSTARTKLLVLHAADFKTLMAQEAGIAQHVHKIVHERKRLNIGMEDADIASEDLSNDHVG